MNDVEGLPASTDIKAWLKEEAVKREREVQEAQAELEANQQALRERQRSVDPEEFMRENLDQLTETQRIITEVCDEFKEFLLKKNAQYGDSAVHPVRIFSRASAEEQLLVRLDDKLSRLVRGDDSIEPDEDILNDVVGYWILLQVVRRKAERRE